MTFKHYKSSLEKPSLENIEALHAKHKIR